MVTSSRIPTLYVHLSLSTTSLHQHVRLAGKIIGKPISDAFASKDFHNFLKSGPLHVVTHGSSLNITYHKGLTAEQRPALTDLIRATDALTISLYALDEMQSMNVNAPWLSLDMTKTDRETAVNEAINFGKMAGKFHRDSVRAQFKEGATDFGLSTDPEIRQSVDGYDVDITYAPTPKSNISFDELPDFIKNYNWPKDKGWEVSYEDKIYSRDIVEGKGGLFGVTSDTNYRVRDAIEEQDVTEEDIYIENPQVGDSVHMQWENMRDDDEVQPARIEAIEYIGKGNAKVTITTVDSSFGEAGSKRDRWKGTPSNRTYTLFVNEKGETSKGHRILMGVNQKNLPDPNAGKKQGQKTEQSEQEDCLGAD
jgi:hypothetical protein